MVWEGVSGLVVELGDDILAEVAAQFVGLQQLR
jgi:hypothetical protein